MKIFAPLLFLITLFVSGWTADKTRIAILALEAKPGVDEGTVSTIGDLLAGELVSLRRFDVIDRKNMQAILREQALQNSGCTESACAVKLGNILNVQKMVVGNVAKLGSKIIISVSFIDVERSKVDLSERATADNDDDILPKIAALAKRIGAQTPLAGRLVTITGAKTALANVGREDGLRVGQTVRILRYGDAIVDSGTGDFLGRKVEEVGEAQVVSLDPGGQLSTLKVGKDVGELRKEDRVLVAAGEVPVSTVSTTATPANDGRAGAKGPSALVPIGIGLSAVGAAGVILGYTVLPANAEATYTQYKAATNISSVKSLWTTYTSQSDLVNIARIAGFSALGLGAGLIVVGIITGKPKETALIPAFDGERFSLTYVRRF